jgi:hypothetical protein
MAKAKAKKTVKSKKEVKTEAPELPKGVTEEPRSPEEMHLKLIKNQPSVVKSYLVVSDDQGELLQEKALEKKVTNFCAKYLPIKKKDIFNPEMLLAETKSLASVYTRQINFRENTIGGTICKYRIRQKKAPVIIVDYHSSALSQLCTSVQAFGRKAYIPIR